MFLAGLCGIMGLITITMSCGATWLPEPLASVPMKLFSNNRNAWLRIDRNVSEDHESFQVEVSVDLGHGRFHVQNDDLFWLNAGEFEAELKAFILDQTIVPHLEGTYGSFVRLKANSKCVIVEFAIGNAFCASKTHDYLFEGSFEIDQQALLRLAREIQLQAAIQS